MYREFLIKEADELGGPSADRALHSVNSGVGAVGTT